MTQKSRKAIIAGIAGQDGSYLAELLVEKGYKVLGFLKKGEDTSNLASVAKDVILEDTELVRKDDIIRWTRLFGPDEVYNFAAMSFIPTSWDDPYGAFPALDRTADSPQHQESHGVGCRCRPGASGKRPRPDVLFFFYGSNRVPRFNL